MHEHKRFTHYCQQCQFVASVRLNQWYDVYRCKSSDGYSLVARFADAPYQYASIDSAVLASSILAYSDELNIIPALRAILIACVHGDYKGRE
jgi:hypothetical protein